MCGTYKQTVNLMAHFPRVIVFADFCRFLVAFIIILRYSNVNSVSRVQHRLQVSSSTPTPTIFSQRNQYGLLANSSSFTFNGTKNYRILSGAIHYFRVPHQYWRDRLERVRALGLNTIETYVAWNLHEPSPGNVDFSDDLNIRKFLQTAQSLGLHVILRPGPYICAEWEFGGLPSWLLRDSNMKVRSLYRPFMEAVDSWFSLLFKQIGDLQFMYGGPIIAIQIENEYGSYGRDFDYIKQLANLLIKHGATELLYCADGAAFAGRVPGIMEALDGQVGLPDGLTYLRKLQPDMPLFVAEFWSGWFDRWGERGHHTWSVDLYTQQLQSILFGPNAASVNLYMAHGGTNFGFMAGASIEPTANALTWKYMAVTTSYDYDAPISEDGTLHPTKFNATRQIIARVTNQKTMPSLPAAPVRRAYGSVMPNGFLSLYPESINVATNHSVTSMLNFVKYFRNHSKVLPMELLDNVNDGAGQQYGYVLYRRDLNDVIKPNETESFTIIISGGVRDRLTVVYDGVQQGTPYPKIMSLYHDTPVFISLDPSFTKNRILNILVENRGRISSQSFYWKRDFLNNQRKGLQRAVEILSSDGTARNLDNGWQIYSLDFNRDFLHALKNSTAFVPVVNLAQHSFPAMLRYLVDIGPPENVADSFLHFSEAIVKGVAFVNGRNLGRFWNSVGPQKSLYIPKWYWNYTVGGNNTIMLFVEEAQLKDGGEGDASDYGIELRNFQSAGPTTTWYGAISS